MESPDRITILLADEDALRRDGLAAVLEGTSKFEIVAHCPDGDAALERMRDLRPDVAVVDLNLPKLHGIELVRRVRSEGLGTKMVILSGTTDDEIVREVVRAGADAYLLKNGPARHLIDAISYVRDGGQCFSPQLRRDGRDRHLLEETPRVPPVRVTRAAEGEAEEEDIREERAPEGRGVRESRYGKARRPARRPVESRRLRERLRDSPEAGNLAERDYEILDLMADGIKPILDRLDEIDARVNQMETGDEPVPSDVRTWLSGQMADTFGDPRSGARDQAPERNIKDLEARLPEMIEEAVSTRFHQMAGRLQKDIEDTHVRTLETFVKNIQVKLVQRVTALESGMSEQAQAMNQLREYSQRTEDNLSRLLIGVDKLAQDLPRRLQAPPAVPPPPPSSYGSAEPLRDAEPVAMVGPKKIRRKMFRGVLPMVFWVVVLGVFAVAVAYHFNPGPDDDSTRDDVETAVARDGGGSLAKPVGKASSKKAPTVSANADTKTKMQAAGEYTERREYPMAEDIYKQVLKSDPNNVDAMKALASVLYREDKIEESAAILDKLPKN